MELGAPRRGRGREAYGMRAYFLPAGGVRALHPQVRGRGVPRRIPPPRRTARLACPDGEEGFPDVGGAVVQARGDVGPGRGDVLGVVAHEAGALAAQREGVEVAQAFTLVRSGQGNGGKGMGGPKAEIRRPKGKSCGERAGRGGAALVGSGPGWRASDRTAQGAGYFQPGTLVSRSLGGHVAGYQGFGSIGSAKWVMVYS